MTEEEKQQKKQEQKKARKTIPEKKGAARGRIGKKGKKK